MSDPDADSKLAATGLPTLASVETRAAARSGLKRGLLSLFASIVLYVGGLAVVLPILLGERLPRSSEEYVRAWYFNMQSGPRYFSWPTELALARGEVTEWLPDHVFLGVSPRPTLSALFGAVLLAAAIVAFLGWLDAPDRPSSILRGCFAHVLGAVPVVAFAVFCWASAFDFERERLVAALTIGLVLAGFGARTLLRNGSLTACFEDSGTAVDAWVAGVFLIAAAISVTVPLPLVLGDWWLQGGLDTHPTFAFTTSALFVAPALVLAVLRDVGWSIARERGSERRDADGVAGTRAEGGDGARPGGRTSPDDASGGRAGAAPDRTSWHLSRAVRSDRRALVGGALLVLLATLAVVVGWHVPDPSLSTYPDDGAASLFAWHSLYPIVHHAVFGLAVALLALLLGVPIARALADSGRRGTVEAVAVDPIATVGQFPILLYVVVYAPEYALSSEQARSFTTRLLALAVVAGVAFAPLVVRVAGDELERGRGSRRAALRGAGVALTGAAVATLAFTFWAYEFSYLAAYRQYEWLGYRYPVLAFAAATTVPLFLLGEGLRSAARREQARDGRASSRQTTDEAPEGDRADASTASGTDSPPPDAR